MRWNAQTNAISHKTWTTGEGKTQWVKGRFLTLTKKNIECVLESMKKVFPENALSIRSAVKDCLAPKGNLLLEIQCARECFLIFYPLKQGCKPPAFRNTIWQKNYWWSRYRGAQLYKQWTRYIGIQLEFPKYTKERYTFGKYAFETYLVLVQRYSRAPLHNVFFVQFFFSLDRTRWDIL